MHTISPRQLFFVLITLLLSVSSLAQNGLSFKVNLIEPYISPTRDQIRQAQHISDLDPQFKSHWVKAYVEIEVQTTEDQKVFQTTGEDATFTPDQIKQMTRSDEGIPVFVTVRYYPDNELKDNSIKEHPFQFVIKPDQTATFPGGEKQMEHYLKNKAIDLIPKKEFSREALAAIKFTIDEEGQVVDVEVFESTQNEEWDTILVRAIQNMPAWTPASYNNGMKVAQEHVLTVGNMESCLVNLLGVSE